MERPLMHRIITPTGAIEQSLVVRWALSLAYTAFAIAGFLLLASPELTNAYGDSALWMAAFIALGGTLCAIGNATRRWPGEFIGALPLACGMAVLGMESWLSMHEEYPWLAGGNLGLMLGIALVAVARWRVVYAVFRFVHAVAKAEKGREKVDGVA